MKKFKEPKEVKSFYNEEYKKVKPYLPRVYLNLDFLKDLDVKAQDLDLKVIYTNSTIIPIFIVNNQSINSYVKLGPTVLEESQGEDMTSWNKMYLLGFKHFDKCKLPDGGQIGDLQSDLDKDYVASKKITRTLQKHLLGWKYWMFKLKGQIK